MPQRSLVSVGFFLLVVFLTNDHNLWSDIIGGQKVDATKKVAKDGKPDPLGPALDAFEKQNFSEFQTAYRLATVYLPLPAEEVFWSRLLLDDGRIEEAIAMLESYQQTSPNDPEVYMTFGFVAMKSRRWTDAQLQFERAETLIAQGQLQKERCNDVVPGLIQLQAEVALQKQQWESAEKFFVQLKELLPDDPLPPYRIGLTQVLSGRLEEGIATMKSARSSSHELPCPHLTVADTLIQSRPWFTNPDEAKIIECQFREAILGSREEIEPWREYLKWLLMMDRSSDALTYLEKVPETVRTSRDMSFIRAVSHRCIEQYEEAESILVELLKSNPGDVEVSDQLILVLLNSTDSEKKNRAKAMAEENLTKFPNIENVIATAGWASLCFDEIQAADQRLSMLFSRGVLSPQSAYFVGKLLERLDRKEEANSVFKSAIEKTGIFPERPVLKKKIYRQEKESQE
ncbi:MAG: tetratricopeptide repeat protein [Pirellula sp.]|jgi:tetratricopeptide (TPR) repeat protein